MDIEFFFYIFDFLGTIAFAVSGAIAAVRKEMDLYGIIVLSLVTAAGGGVVRDILIGQIPPIIFTQPAYIGLVLAASLVVFFLHEKIEHVAFPLLYMDAIGLGVFTIIGVRAAISLDISWYGAIIMGVTTGTVGGMVRDVLRQQIPLVLKKEVYASACLAGAGVYYFLNYLQLPEAAAAIIGFVTVVVIRLLSIRHNWHLPKAKATENK